MFQESRADKRDLAIESGSGGRSDVETTLHGSKFGSTSLFNGFVWGELAYQTCNYFKRSE